MRSKKIKKQKGGNESNPLTLTNSNTSNNTVTNNTLPLPTKRLPYDVKIFSFMCILGILIKIIFSNTSNDYATASVYGYGFSILALFGLLVGSFAISYKEQYSQGVMGFFKVILKNAIPLILLISIMGIIVYQNIYFYDQINEGHVANEYYQFSFVSSFLILIQVCLVINYMMKIIGGEENTGNKSGIMAAMASELNSLILILSITNIGIIGILQVILKYFSTDG